MVKVVRRKYNGTLQEIAFVPIMMNELPRENDHLFLGSNEYVVRHVEWSFWDCKDNVINEVRIVVW